MNRKQSVGKSESKIFWCFQWREIKRETKERREREWLKGGRVVKGGWKDCKKGKRKEKKEKNSKKERKKEIHRGNT